MKPRIPKGGFFAAKFRDQKLGDLEHRLKESGAQTLTVHAHDLILAAWKEFPGQGLWADGNAAVAYDLDLTNEAELLKSVDLGHNERSDPGQLLWSLYRKFGLDFLDRPRGAFGFALWDRKKRQPSGCHRSLWHQACCIFP